MDVVVGGGAVVGALPGRVVVVVAGGVVAGDRGAVVVLVVAADVPWVVVIVVGIWTTTVGGGISIPRALNSASNWSIRRCNRTRSFLAVATTWVTNSTMNMTARAARKAATMAPYIRRSTRSGSNGVSGVCFGKW